MKFMLKKQWGVGGHRPKFKHDYTENVKNLGWRGRGVGMENFGKKHWRGGGLKFSVTPLPCTILNGTALSIISND